MEELLPLIIGVLWLAYTFYTRGQKKKSPGQSPSENQERKKPSFLEQLLSAEGLQVGSPEPVEYEEEFDYEAYEEPSPVPLKVEKERISPFLNTELSRFEEEGQLQFREAFALDEEDTSEGYDIPSELRQQIGEFDLKKAVVFSAILDAPYIDYK